MPATPPSIGPGEIDVIGGNVRDSVTKKTLALNERGLLADRSHPWFVVLRRLTSSRANR